MIETLIHTPQGRLKVQKPTQPLLESGYKRGCKLSDVKLDHEDEYYLGHFRPLHERWGQLDAEEKIILNYYRRLKKHNCKEVRPLFHRHGYWRATVSYPDGAIRRWWCWSDWKTDSTNKRRLIQR